MSIALALALAVAGPVVRTDDGPVRGEAAGTGAVFRGIPFAAPPVGALRWRAPERPRRWTQPRNAIATHAACPQVVYGDWNRAAAEASDEDCLFVDVRTPDLAGKLPVLVWIHGGSNRAGAGGGTVESRITDKGIVLVSVQYRLGALGFLSHPALSREQGGHSGNYGLMDQQAALRWVRRNIAAFGGDPDRVTIAGESAGAMDVGLHLLSPGSRGLFRQAIAESGTAGFGTAPRSLAANEALGARIATRAGLPANATAAQLRALPMAAVLAADDKVDAPGLDDDSFVWLQAVVDGRVLPDTPARLLARGGAAPAPLMIGVNARELGLHGGLSAARATVLREFGANAPAALRLYGLQPGGTPVTDARLGDVTAQLATDLTFRCPTIAVSDALTAHGGRVWQYQFDYAPPGGTVSHASELGYLFNPPQPGQPPLQAYWVDFVKTGDPDGAGLAHWPAYDRGRRAYMAFDQDGPVVKTGLRRAICALREAP
ncbi:carboxylesterase family protein [Sphingomonas sp. A2-49]|uniref:carboxylesterase/lipase family protein n=1 Tax=Sphingomonas sp. A2-49 TaxID=1391375 RepID=UPI0021D03976|nr:carboxylesterase family protein [Sphingomonas sp. A2-49]MCU6453694.1 carboxylesterase family protein [Sphingomonas sp. A2-49]